MRVKLKDIASFSKGIQINGSDLEANAKYDFLNGGIHPSGKWNNYNVSGNTITISEGGNSCGYVNYMEKPFWCGAHCYYLFNVNGNSKYIFYALKSQQERLMQLRSGACMPNIKKDSLAEFEFNYEKDISRQKFVVSVLDKVHGLTELRKQQLAKLDKLVKARFVEMFGDPVQNPMEWETMPLLTIGTCKNGMNFHSGDSGAEIHCLGVGDFKDLFFIYNVSDLPIVSLQGVPSDDYMLQDGDIVFVRSNGNKALVGRSLAVYPGNTPTTFSGFCIRFRPNHEVIETKYMLMALKTASMRKKMAGRGANIQNLNQKILSELIIPVPPLALQTQFANFIEQTNESALTIQQSLDKLEVLKKSLMQEYFGR